MNFNDRLGNQDVDAAALFAAARAFRPSARGRRRALRALGLPIGLSLFGSGLAHAAYVISSSLKGWGMVAGVVATVGAAGSVTYVVATAPSAPSRAVSNERPRPRSTQSRHTVPASVSAGVPAGVSAGVLAPAPSEVAMANAPADVPNVPDVLPGPAPVPVPVAVPVPVRRLAMRAEPRALPSTRLADASGPSPQLPSMPPSPPAPAERPVEVFPPPPFQTPRPAVTSVSSSLNGELALVAEAQARLRAGDGQGAVAALDRHLRVYPDGALAEEVQLLRVRTFIATGDPRGARKTGEAFLQRHPSSPLVARFRSLMNALDVPAIP
jgi:hypothetical protein